MKALGVSRVPVKHYLAVSSVKDVPKILAKNRLVHEDSGERGNKALLITESSPLSNLLKGR